VAGELFVLSRRLFMAAGKPERKPAKTVDLDAHDEEFRQQIHAAAAELRDIGDRLMHAADLYRDRLNPRGHK
jgi:hypothetical protein